MKEAVSYDAVSFLLRNYFKIHIELHFNTIYNEFTEETYIKCE